MRLPCSIWQRPTDEEAVEAGFKDAKEWYAYSAGGALVSPAVLQRNYERLCDALPTSAPPEGDPSHVQQWRALQGDVPDVRVPAGGDTGDAYGLRVPGDADADATFAS